MVRILSGKEVAAALNQRSLSRSRELSAAGFLPCLATVRLGEAPGDLAYERSIRKRCEALEVALRSEALPADCKEEELLLLLRSLSADPTVHGILLFRPLPGSFSEERVNKAIAPEKDLDGSTEGSAAGLYLDRPLGFPPCTARAVMEILDYYGVPIEGKKALVLGRSAVIGKPVAHMLLKANATVTICHSRSENVSALCKEADILIAAAGKMAMVNADYCRSGQTVIDVGIHNGPDGKLCGDVDFNAAADLDLAITPVPGGVGSVTTAILLSHLLDAAERAARRNL